jgi:methyl-accepting chemotaxis protein
MNNAQGAAGQRLDEVQSADETLRSIAERVSNIHSMNEAMAQTVEQQVQITHTVQSSIASINDTANSTTEVAGLTSGQSEEIVRLARELEDKVKTFKF